MTKRKLVLRWQYLKSVAVVNKNENRICRPHRRGVFPKQQVFVMAIFVYGQLIYESGNKLHGILATPSFYAHHVRQELHLSMQDLCNPIISPRTTNSTNSDLTSHLIIFVIKGCFNASAGVIRFSGLSARQRSSRSTNRFNSFVSTSVRPFDADMRRVRRSRDGLTNARVLIVSYNRQSHQNLSFGNFN